MATRFDVERFPRMRLAHAPTPLEPLERLSRHLGGPRLWIKRDDCTGLALGGNKVRKLEFLLGRALADGADTVVTVGGVQSNHARQTAAAAARLGLDCELVLPRLVDRRDPLYEESGNVLLDRLLGARIHLVEDEEEAARRVAEILSRVEGTGGKAAFFPSGGSTPIGALGYVVAAHEVVRQLRDAGIASPEIVVATSTGGTLAGLATGLHALGQAARLTGVAVYDEAEATWKRTRNLAVETARLLGIGPPPHDAFAVTGDQLGPGYGAPTDAMREALELCARLEGLLLDPVYTGKAMASLIDRVRRREIPRSTDAIFLHTGGTPALFACG